MSATETPTLQDLLAAADEIEAEAQRQRNALISELAAARVELDELRRENEILRRRGLTLNDQPREKP